MKLEKGYSKLSFLVSGGCGFIGSNLVEKLLQKGALKVVIADNLLTGLMQNITHLSHYKNLEVKIGDLRDIDFCNTVTQGIDVVFHQAALGSVPRSIEDPIQTHHCNLTAFLNTIHASNKNGVTKFIYASSSSVYGDDEHLPKQEQFIGKPLSPYAVSKIGKELYANVYSKLYKMQITGLRYFNVFGPRQSPDGPYAAVIAKFIYQMAMNKEIIIYGNGQQKRDFTFVENVVDANLKVLNAEYSTVSGKVFNIAGGRANCVNTLYDILAKKMNYNQAPIYLASRNGDIKNSFADINLAKKIIGYEPIVSFEDGLELTIPWILSSF